MIDKTILGIDPGINGGLCIIKNKEVIDKQVMFTVGKDRKEYDIHAIVDYVKNWNVDLTILEKAQPHFRDGCKQGFKTGFGFGMLQTILITLKIPFKLVASKDWQRVLFKGLNCDDTKTASVLYCKRLFPHIDWTPTERSKKAHDGMTDACCIGMYAYE